MAAVSFYIRFSALFSKFVSAGVFNTRYSIKHIQVTLNSHFHTEVRRIVQQVHGTAYCRRKSNTNTFCNVFLICVVSNEYIVVFCIFSREHSALRRIRTI